MCILDLAPKGIRVNSVKWVTYFIFHVYISYKSNIAETKL